jgi:hypothetical protein
MITAELVFAAAFARPRRSLGLESSGFVYNYRKAADELCVEVKSL